VAELCRQAGISQATFFNWKKKYSGMLPSEMKRLRELEHENERLKKIVADLTLDREMLQDVIKRSAKQLRSTSFEACPDARAGGGDVQGLGGLDSACLRGAAV
jgi:transposase-like protein